MTTTAAIIGKNGQARRKISLITGGSDNISFATDQQFLIEGVAQVFITVRRQDALNERQYNKLWTAEQS